MKANINTKYGKREIMLVAHYVAKRFKQTLSESLMDAWRWLKSGNKNFTDYLKMTVKAKRVDSLKDFDVMGAFYTTKNNTRTTIEPAGAWFWNEKYNILF